MESQLSMFDILTPTQGPGKVIPISKIIHLSKYQKDIAWLLLQPKHYMIETTNANAQTIYKVYDENNVPVQYFYRRQIEKFIPLLKTDFKDRITLNLNLVRQLRGNTHLKSLYKKYRNHGHKK